MDTEKERQMKTAPCPKWNRHKWQTVEVLQDDLVKQKCLFCEGAREKRMKINEEDKEET